MDQPAEAGPHPGFVTSTTFGASRLAGASSGLKKNPTSTRVSLLFVMKRKIVAMPHIGLDRGRGLTILADESAVLEQHPDASVIGDGLDEVARPA